MTSDLNSPFLVQVISTNNIIRSGNLEAKLNEFELKYQITPGVIPNEIDYHDGLLHAKIISKFICQRNISIGEVGCALAHRVVTNKFLNSNYEFGIIFEDDAEVIMDFNFDTLIELLDSELPIIVALGWIPGIAVSKNPQITDDEELIELITPPTCTFAYAINRPAAKLMIGSHEKIVDVADWPIYMLNKVHFYAPRLPWVTANHDPEFSTIGVRSLPISTRPIGVLVSRIRLATYFLALVLLSSINKLGASPKQIVHQLFIRGSLHRYGVSQVTENSTTNEVMPLPLKFKRIRSLLKID